MDLIRSVVWWVQTIFIAQRFTTEYVGQECSILFSNHMWTPLKCFRVPKKIIKLTFPQKQKQKYSFDGHLTPWPLIRATLIVCLLHLHTNKWHTIDSMASPNTLWKCGSKWSVEFNKNVSAKYSECKWMRSLHFIDWNWSRCSWY